MSQVVLATFKNLPAERVQPVPIYCRYIYKRYIFSGPDILPMPIYCRYVSDIALCSFKRIWGAMEYLTVLIKQTLHQKWSYDTHSQQIYNLVVNTALI